MRMFTAMTTLTIVLFTGRCWAGPYAPAVGQPGSTAVINTSPLFVEWSYAFQDLVLGPQNITNPGGAKASFGTGNEALGFPDGNTSHIVSLGDGGKITLLFDHPITNGLGADLAVFENSFSDTFLELAFVEVSSNGADFVRFPAVSLTQTTTQLTNAAVMDTTNLDNLAGKYRAGYGTPFDLSTLTGLSANVDLDRIKFVRIVDVIGTINPTFGSRDSLNNLINDPYSTAFASGGFDLDGVGAFYTIPEPSSVALLAIGAVTALIVINRRAKRAS